MANDEEQEEAQPLAREQKPSLAESRAERIAEMVGNLLPRIRPLSGNLSEDELLEAAAYMAVYRVADQEGSTDP